MGIVVNGLERIKNFTQACIDELDNQIVLQLNYLGQECVTKVRDRSAAESWNDQTANLRSSIGAGVYQHAKEVLSTAFEAVAGKNGTGTNGSAVGKNALERLATQYQNTYVMLVVAGMEYASYVENMNGKDVLASTELWARSQLEERITDAVNNAVARINKMTL